MPSITLSIVSHGQASLIAPLLADLQRLALADAEILITVNIPEDESPFHSCNLPCRIIRNKWPKGFGENHNQAFEQSNGDYFVIVNPDIRLPAMDVDLLMAPMNDPTVGVVAPRVLNSMGGIEDSVRHFPTILGLVSRLLLRRREPGYRFKTIPIYVDWVGGMFAMFRREAYQAVSGFDNKRYFMYYEDVDICRRLNDKGWRIVLQPTASVIHDAQRASHRNFKHLRWHLISAFRYFTGL
jgi:GT2 family glycosyltransferase